jgi:hypothetical protein
MDLNIVSTFGDLYGNHGLLSYLSFNDVLQIKLCSKYLNSIRLPATAKCKISQKKTFNDALKIIAKNGEHIKTLVLPYNMSVCDAVEAFVKLCPYLTSMSLSCVVLCEDFKQGLRISNVENRIMTQNYFKLDIFKSIREISVRNSYVGDDFKLHNCVVNKSDTYAKCKKCNNIVNLGFNVMCGFYCKLLDKNGKISCTNCVHKSTKSYSHGSGKLMQLLVYGASDAMLIVKRKKEKFNEVKMNRAYKKMMKNKIK